MNKSDVNIVFVHKGYSPYLPVTLRLARMTNPNANLHLIGDSENRGVALDCGWSHTDFASLQSETLNKFRSVYRLISSKNHPDIHNNCDMTKFCFERYFFAVEAARKDGLSRFWMFDSDDLILEDLTPFQENLEASGVIFTRMANNTAPRGMMDLSQTRDYCDFCIDCFSDQKILLDQESFFSSRKDICAFTDMNVGMLFHPKSKSAHLATAIDNWHFDDCILDTTEFEATKLGFLQRLPVKHVRFDGKHFLGIRKGLPVKFATVNGSGLSRHVFPWFLECAQNRSKGMPLKSTIKSAQAPWWREVGYQIKKYTHKRIT